MKIAIFSDPHLGYSRFEEDSYANAETVIIEASEKADLILCAGDIFDIRIPKLETIKRAVDIFNKSKVKIVVIFGNHERRPKDLINPVQLLVSCTHITLIHGNPYVFEKNGEKIQILGIGYVPDDFAAQAIKNSMTKFVPVASATRILMIHQSIKDLIPDKNDDYLSLDYLESLPFDLIINGHIHETTVKLGGRFIIPGSTVITQLKKEQMEPRGYFMYDTNSKTSEFVPVRTRRLFYDELSVSDADEAAVKSAIDSLISNIRSKEPTSIISIKLTGTIKGSVNLPQYDSVFIDNRLDAVNLGARIERIRELRANSLSTRDTAISELGRRIAGKISLFTASELFEYLIIGSGETEQYLERIYKNNE